MTRIVQTFVEHSTKESLIERTKKLVFALLLTYPLEFVLQVVGIHIKEALFLNEVTEHESVEHNAGIPILVLVIIDTRNVFLEGSMLLAELRIEVLSDLLTVQMERAMHTILDICNQNALGEIEGQIINLGEKEVCLGSTNVFCFYKFSLLVGLDWGKPQMVCCTRLNEDTDIVVTIVAKLIVYLLAFSSSRQNIHLA